MARTKNNQNNPFANKPVDPEYEEVNNPDVQVNINQDQQDYHDPYNADYIQEQQDLDQQNYPPADYGGYYDYQDDHKYEEEDEGQFSIIRFLVAILLFIIICLIVFGLLIEFGVIKGFDEYRPSELLGLEKNDDKEGEKTDSSDKTVVNQFEDCKDDGGEVADNYCVKDEKIYFDEMTIEEFEGTSKNQTLEDGVITLAPKNWKEFSGFRIGDGYPYQTGVVGYSSKLHDNWTSFAYMVINSPKLDSANSSDKEVMAKVANFVDKKSDKYNDQPYLFKAFEIGERELENTYLMGEVEGVEYKNVDSYRAIYALDGGGSKSRLVIRIFAKKGDYLIMLEENLDADYNKELAEKHYKPCITENGDGNSSKDCYAEKLKGDSDFQDLIKEAAKDLVDNFKI